MMEARIITRLKEGDKRAFDTIYAMYADKIFRFCLHHLNSIQDAEEVVQDVFVALWKSRESIRATDSLKPLLYTSARFKILNKYRARIDNELLEDYRLSIENPSAENDNFGIEYREFEQNVMNAIAQLSGSQRRIIIMSRFRNMSNAEIAQELNLSIQTVRNTLSIGLKNLRDKLSGHIYYMLPLFSCYIIST